MIDESRTTLTLDDQNDNDSNKNSRQSLPLVVKYSNFNPDEYSNPIDHINMNENVQCIIEGLRQVKSVVVSQDYAQIRSSINLVIHYGLSAGDYDLLWIFDCSSIEGLYCDCISLLRVLQFPIDGLNEFEVFAQLNHQLLTSCQFTSWLLIFDGFIPRDVLMFYFGNDFLSSRQGCTGHSIIITHLVFDHFPSSSNDKVRLFFFNFCLMISFN